MVSDEPVASKNSLNGLNAKQLMLEEWACHEESQIRTPMLDAERTPPRQLVRISKPHVLFTAKSLLYLVNV